MIQALPREYVTGYEVARLEAATGEWIVEHTIPCKLKIETKEVRLLLFRFKQPCVHDYRKSVLEARRAAYHQMQVNDNNFHAIRRIVEVSHCDDYYERRSAAWLDGKWRWSP